MTCPNCGANMQEGSAFCTNCGTRFEEQQASYQQPVYQQPVAQQPAGDDLRAPLTTGQFLLMYLVSCIPLVGRIMWFVWAFGSNTNVNRKSWARATLIRVLIVLILTVLSVLYNVIFYASSEFLF